MDKVLLFGIDEVRCGCVVVCLPVWPFSEEVFFNNNLRVNTRWYAAASLEGRAEALFIGRPKHHRQITTPYPSGNPKHAECSFEVDDVDATTRRCRAGCTAA
ncbi:hypothetical protein [Thiocapsa sp.]|uniref:hypothetical protein n=1 Tax=Thiocapsa sp. TaxID=2024551 RepID=UPI0025D89372|nr:hypothetical protein [Thiocapsa sp.]